MGVNCERKFVFPKEQLFFLVKTKGNNEKLLKERKNGKTKYNEKKIEHN